MNNIDLNMFYALWKISQVIKNKLWEISKKVNLSPIQIQSEQYHQQSDQDSVTITELSEEFDIKKATISESVNTLIKKGILAKEQSQYDKRSYPVRLTEASNEVISIIQDSQSDFMKDISKMEEQDKESSINLLNSILKFFYDEGALKRLRICQNCAFYKSYDDGKFLCTRDNKIKRESQQLWNCPHYNS